ncbi:hypothetical protein QE152_g18992 [Popillia japonica]|uniref:Uncharacterized protein n=1 Tax=Popillia japonica TaxID=7064 RepID=A0AAW1L3B8_POPJA
MVIYATGYSTSVGSSAEKRDYTRDFSNSAVEHVIFLHASDDDPLNAFLLEYKKKVNVLRDAFVDMEGSSRRTSGSIYILKGMFTNTLGIIFRNLFCAHLVRCETICLT